jgi:hypothetical protein
MLETVLDQAGLMQVISGSLLGLFGGVGATALWEGFVRPTPTRRHLARLLVAEVRINYHQVEWLVKQRSDFPNFLPLNVSFSTSIFDSLAEQVGELPEDMLQDLVRLYGRFRNVTGIGSTLSAMFDAYESAAEESELKVRLNQRMQERIDALYLGVERCRSAIADVLPKLVRCAAYTSVPPSSMEKVPEVGK